MLLQDMSLVPTILVGSLGCLVFYILSFYFKVSKYPKGPTPLPFIGNILTFRKGKSVYEVLYDLSHEYNPLFTIFMGPVPLVVISDSKLGIDCMRKVAFAGRPDYGFTKFMFPDKSVDVFFGDYSREWDVLKKVSHEAIKKYTRSAFHPHVVARVVDEVFDTRRKDGVFCMTAIDDFTLMINNILASAAFGKNYSLDDPEFLSWRNSLNRQGTKQGQLLLTGFIPALRFVFRDMWKMFTETKEFQRGFVRDRYNESMESFDGANVTTFCQAVISAQRDAEADDKDIIKFMTPGNLHNVVFDLFFAGTDTTKNTLAWIFLFICKNPDMQERIRKEIADVVGNSETTALPSHKDDCHYTMAFIAEVMRHRTITPAGVPHKTTTDVEVAGYKLPKGTIVLHPYYKALHEPDAWNEPLKFNPERFLVDGKFSKLTSPNFISFGVGRRSCPGNQLANLTMFLVIARLMQRTSAVGHKFVVDGGNDSIGYEGQKIAASWISTKYNLTTE
jgi:ecdysteroid 25-hydroxylase CYP306A1